MDDVGLKVFGLQSIPAFKRDSSGAVVSDPDQLLPWNELLKAGWTVLDPSQPNGLNIRQNRYAEAGLDTPAKKASAAGQLFALERTTGATRLFFVWVPGSVLRRLENASLPAPLNAHILFHPPTYEKEYLNTQPYWSGRNKGTGKAHYVDLGIRYACSDFRVVAHHVMAVTGKNPYLIYVVPVATSDQNFSDLIDPPQMLRILQEIYEFLARRFSPRGRPRLDRIGRIMLSGYSRSGNRLTAIMETLDKYPSFFADHLSQINAFDINLGDNDQQRLPVFIKFWANLRRWKTRFNRRARAYIYTAYASHSNHVRSLPVSPTDVWDIKSFNLDQVPWNDEKLKSKLPRMSRGVAAEGYNADGSCGLIHLPVGLFQWYLGDGREFVGNKAHGMAYGDYHIGGLHGHGLFLRVLMSQALAHADPVFYTAR